MTTASVLIQRAFRQDNILGAGETPTSAEQTEALAELNDIINYFFGFELGELVNDWYVPPIVNTAQLQQEDPRDPFGSNTIVAEYTAPPINARILAKISAPTTVYLPQYPNDGSRIALSDMGSVSTALTLSANGRLIEGAASVAVNLGTTPQAEWFYRADLADWQLRADLAITDQSPFPAKYDKLLVCALSLALAPRYGREPTQVTATTYSNLLGKFRAQYKQYTPTPASYDIQEVQSFRVDAALTPGTSFQNG